MGYFKNWFKLKKDAVEGKNEELYAEFLRLALIDLTRLYSKSDWPRALKFIEKLLNTIKKERQWLARRQEEKKLPF